MCVFINMHCPVQINENETQLLTEENNSPSYSSLVLFPKTKFLNDNEIF